jgi:hypothetical protein
LRGAGDFLLEHFLAASLFQAQALQLQGLVFGGDAGVAEFHPRGSGEVAKLLAKVFTYA